jgi:acetyl-CoA acetyltransferases
LYLFLELPFENLKEIWSKHGAPELGAKVILEVLNQSKVLSSDIDEIIMGQVLTGNTGQNPARQAAMMAGIPTEKTAYIINQVCGSGLRAVVAGYQSILSGDCEAVIAGGQESMTNSKEELMFKDGLIDAYKKYHMGITAENVAEKFQISRKDQDKFAVSSQLKAQEAIKNNKFKEEMINGDKLLDEHPRSNVTEEGLSKLKTAFKENGTVTAGNSSGVNDGAAAILLMNRKKAESYNLKPLAKIVSWATSGVEPALMGTGPIPATNKALKKIGWSIKDLDLIESNEAFAASKYCSY